MDAVKDSPVVWPATGATMGEKAYLKTPHGANKNKPDPAFASKSGFLHACEDAAAAGGAREGVGHLFGRLG